MQITNENVMSGKFIGITSRDLVDFAISNNSDSELVTRVHAEVTRRANDETRKVASRKASAKQAQRLASMHFVQPPAPTAPSAPANLSKLKKADLIAMIEALTA